MRSTMNGRFVFLSLRKLFVRILVMSFLAFSGISNITAAQRPDFADKAASLAKALDHSDVGVAPGLGVVVFDFVGPDAAITLLGRGLADDFSSALSKFNGRFYVVDRSYLAQAMEKKHLAPIAIEDADVSYWIAKAVGARAFVIGKLWSEGSDLTLELNCFRVGDRMPIQKTNMTLPVTANMATLLQTNVDPDSRVEMRGSKQSGSSGPTCDKCSGQPDANPNAKPKYHGKVLMLAVVGEDGSVRDLQVVEGLSYGLTVKALEQVQTWKFVPAKNADGKPVAVRTPLEVTFDLYQ
jgi:TolB-like protein